MLKFGYLPRAKKMKPFITMTGLSGTYWTDQRWVLNRKRTGQTNTCPRSKWLATLLKKKMR